MRNLSATVSIGHYEDAIRELRAALTQLRSMQRGKGQSLCAVCEDTGHTAEGCWYHNPLLLAALGDRAILGQFWRCFHCGAVFTDEESARGHFGTTEDELAKCLRQLAGIFDEEVA